MFLFGEIGNPNTLSLKKRQRIKNAWRKNSMNQISLDFIRLKFENLTVILNFRN
jgi:hypothetical protein